MDGKAVSSSSKRGASCMLESGRCANSGMKRTRGQFERDRGKSILGTVESGVCFHQGSRSCMEDLNRIVMWEELPLGTRVSRLEEATKELCNDLGETVEIKATANDSRNLERVSFFAVSDGHGGVQAAEFVNAHLFNKIVSQPTFKVNPEAAIRTGFAETESAFMSFVEEKDLDGLIGTTATVAIIVGNHLFVANIGDSEAILCTNGEGRVLTECHVPNNDEERKRVESLGGVVLQDRVGNYRLGHPNWNAQMVNLGLTRAIGDFFFKKDQYLDGKVSGLIAEPFVCKVDLTTEDEFLLIASDGFWEVILHAEAIKLVRDRLQQNADTNKVCQELIQMCNKRNCTDNVTVMLIKLKDSPPLQSECPPDLCQ